MGKSIRPGRKRRFFLLLLCAVLALIIYRESVIDPMRENRSPVAMPAPVAVDPLPAEPSFDMPPPETFSEIVSRPLFSSSRRPPSPTPEAIQSAPVASRQIDFVLVGVIITPDKRTALVQRASIGDVIRVTEGQELEGWLVEAIKPDRVVFRSGDLVEEVRLRDDFKSDRARRKRNRQKKP